jgi:hypothetical protein
LNSSDTSATISPRRENAHVGVGLRGRAVVVTAADVRIAGSRLFLPDDEADLAVVFSFHAADTTYAGVLEPLGPFDVAALVESRLSSRARPPVSGGRRDESIDDGRLLPMQYSVILMATTRGRPPRHRQTLRPTNESKGDA